jgi:hypothetical protein
MNFSLRQEAEAFLEIKFEEIGREEFHFGPIVNLLDAFGGY